MAVRKKQMTSRSAMIITKIKLESVSKPSRWANCSRGSGKMAIIMKTRGRRSQAIELLIDMEFLRRLKKIRMRRIRAAMDTSIWILVMWTPF